MIVRITGTLIDLTADTAHLDTSNGLVHEVLLPAFVVQRLAPSLGKPVLVTRESTERPEALAAGATKLVGTDTDRVVAEVSRLLVDKDAYAAMQIDSNPYGDGSASRAILDAIIEHTAVQDAVRMDV